MTLGKFYEERRKDCMENNLFTVCHYINKDGQEINVAEVPDNTKVIHVKRYDTDQFEVMLDI